MRYLILFLVLVQGMVFCADHSKGVLRILLVRDGIALRDRPFSRVDDSAYLQKTFRNISSTLRMQFKVTKISLLNFSFETFRAWTQQIHPRRDISIVYYSGLRKVWLSRSGTQIPIPSSDDLKEILLKSNPRLAVICFDCYEDLISSSECGVEVAKPVSKKTISKYRKCFRDLFLHNYGCIQLDFPAPTENGYCVVQNGLRQGGFTRALLKSFKHPAKSWDLLAKEIQFSLSHKSLPKHHFTLLSSH